jgi:D-beta-D-heptose 7-phosphate kinase/D-beta-D-heptose 1-phosphate adenosyltransferase
MVLTSGSFDLLHAGHVALLEAARLEGEVLIVAIESDRTLRELKGPGRPLTPAVERGEILLALEPVDRVVVYEQTPREVIAALRPDVLVTGTEPLRDELAARAMIEASGGRLVRVEPLPGRSTMALLERIRRP